MKHILSLAFLTVSISSWAQVTLEANGPGDTYELITQVLAPGYDPIEEPDCGHQEFGRHIDEVFDETLNDHAFRFLIHVEPDNDRCQTFDRQRNEIKSYSQSPDNLLGIEEEIVQYKWKFKLPAGFQPSGNFTHIHQLKSVGGPYASHPMYTITLRKSNPDRLELRYGAVSSSEIVEQTPLEPFLDTWVTVTETITYGVNGTYEISLNRLSDNAVLISYATDNIVNWREDADFVRPKWGIYRSLNSPEDLRDEEVLFADFSIEELDTLSLSDQEAISAVTVYADSSANQMVIQNIPTTVKTIRLFSLTGKLILERNLEGKQSLTIDSASLSAGVYVVSLSDTHNTFTKKLIIQ